MATSGSKSAAVSSWDTLNFKWEVIEQSVANNTSTISWQLDLVATSSGAIYSSAPKGYAVIIEGETFNGSNYVNIGNNETKTLASGVKTITHNIDGTKTFSYTFTQLFEITFSNQWIGSVSASGTGSLPQINQKATILSAPNFNDEENPTITYSNPVGTAATSLQACISWTGADDIAYREISKTGSSYTFNLTDAERAKIRNYLSNANSKYITFYIATVLNGTTYTSTLRKTVSIVNATPTLSPVVKDVGGTSVSLTGDENVIIKGFNYVQVSSGAAALKGASIVSQQITCGKDTINAGSGAFNNAESGTFIFTVKDSRGNVATQTVEKELIPYVMLTCNLNVQPPDTDGKMSFTIYGNYFYDTFGKEANMLTVHYRYKANNEEYSEWIAVPIIANYDNTYSLPVELTGLDYLNSYTIQAKAADKVLTIESIEEKVKTTPIFDWSENDFNFNVPVSMPELTVGGMSFHASKVLWSNSGWHMNDTEYQIITLPEEVSKQTYGLLLIFAVYDGETVADQFQQFFISKEAVRLHPGGLHTFIMASSSNFAAFGAKSLYITDTTIQGVASNTDSGSKSSISYDNSKFVLRYVIGV